jgi:hypothetical protein
MAMNRAFKAALLLGAAVTCARGEAPKPAPGVHFLPEEAWLFAAPSGGRWSAEMEEEQVTALPPTSELRLQLTQPLEEFRVRLIDDQGDPVPYRASAHLAPAGEQVHTLLFAAPLAPGRYRLVIDAPLGGALRDPAGRRFRGQRFRLLVQRESADSAASLANIAASSGRSLR